MANNGSEKCTTVLVVPPCWRKDLAMPKMKTHSGAKKRMKLLKSGKIKRKQVGVRHLNSHMSSKRKRHLGDVVYVDDANYLQARRLLVF